MTERYIQYGLDEKIMLFTTRGLKKTGTLLCA